MKPDELYEIIESCSPGQYLELFARFSRPRWSYWGNEAGLNGEQIKVHATYRGNGLRKPLELRAEVSSPGLWQ